MAIERPVTVLVGVVLVVLFGGLSVTQLPIQLTPDITVPTLTVSTAWPGAGPLEVEADILEPQEEALRGIAGLVEMTSQARFGRGSVTLELEVGTDIDDALVRASNALSQISGYPDAADEPSLSTSGSSGPPLAVVAVRSPAGDPVAAYRSWLEDTIVPQLERIDGIASIRLIGGQPQEVHIDFDANALAARGLSVGRLVSRVRESLRDRSAGDITLGKRRLLVRTRVAPEELSELEQLVLAARPGEPPIRLSDVGTVRLGLRKGTGIAMNDRRPSMVLLVFREAGSNLLEVTEALREQVGTLNISRFVPEGLEMEVLSDQSYYIDDALSRVQQNLLLGALLAVAVLLLFLRSVGAGAVVAVAIPVSAFGTALGMSLLGRSVNVVSLAGITFAIGMVLDNSIVALEAIDVARGEGLPPKKAALAGIRRVWGAIFASTATTMAVFVPVIAWEGEVGQLLRDVAVAIAFAVGVSLLVSVWVIPSFAGKLLREKKQAAPLVQRLLRPVDRLAANGVQLTTRILERLVRSRIGSALVVLVAALSCILVAWALLPPLEYLPRGGRNLIFGVLTPPEGTSLVELERIGRRVQARMTSEESRGEDGTGPVLARSFFVGSPDAVFAGAVAEDPARVGEVVAYVRQVQREIPGVLAFTTQGSIFGRSLGGGRSIELQLFGGDLDELSAVTETLFAKVREVFPDSQARPVPALSSGVPELRVRPDRTQLARIGMSPAELGIAVDALVDGAYVGELSQDGRTRLDVVVRGQGRGGRRFDTPSSLRTAPLVSMAETGNAPEILPLSVLAAVDETLGPTALQRIERRRAMTVQLTPPDDQPLEEAIAQLQSEVVDDLRDTGQLPAAVELSLRGAASDLDAAKSRFVGILWLAVVISFLLMAALFEDFLAPLVVLITVPLAAAGGTIGLWLLDSLLVAQPLDLMTALGFLILLGVVVNNAILVVDGALLRLRAGAGLEEATVDAVRARVRPIMMTTTTSLAGLLPMVLIQGSGSEFYRGVGAVVLGGLFLSTLLTLFVVPCLFGLLWRTRVPPGAPG